MSISDVERVLARYPADCRPVAVEPRGSGGGLSGAIFWRLTTPRGQLCLRRWPSDFAEPSRLAWIHQVVCGAARRCAFPLPVPIDATGGESFAAAGGHFWELTTWLEGSPLTTSLDDVQRIPAAMQALAELHLALAAYAVSEGGLSDLQIAPAAGVHKRLATLRGVDFPHLVRDGGRFPPRGPFSAAIRCLAGILERRWGELSTAIAADLARASRLRVPLQPCLRDIWRPHVLFRDGEVSGIVDFGALAVDNVATDVSRLLGSLVGESPDAAWFRDGWQAGLAAYAATRPLSRDERRLVATYDRSGVLIGAANWLRWLAVEMRPFPPAADVAGRVCRLADRVERLETAIQDHPSVL